MVIEKLEIKNFGKLRDLTINFSKGLNIIFGKNESGKTSVQSFIKAMLYGMKSGRSAKDGSLPPLKKYKPWSGSDYNGSLEYRLDSGELFRVEKNFGGNEASIFDSSYKDITGNFEISRDKGILFAERQLGVGESCFEKTVFIRQMEAKLGEDGSKELIDKLLNVSQTGLEDVSFNRAQEAIKEAMKNYVGTEKTSTKPLDNVIARLEELKHQRKECIDKRMSVFKIENELNEEIEEKEKLEEKKAVIQKLKKLADTRRELELAGRQRSELLDILEEIKRGELELATVTVKLDELNRDKTTYEKFSEYNNEDIDELNIGYHTVQGTDNEIKKLTEKAGKIRKGLEVLYQRLEELKEFQSYGEDIIAKVSELVSDLERLRSEKEMNNIESLDERIQAAVSKNRRVIYNLAGVSVLAVMFAFLWFVSPVISYFGLPFALTFVGIMMNFKYKASKELADLMNIKKVAFVFTSGIFEEIDRKQKTLDEILKKVGAKNVEDFFELRSEFTSIVNQIKSDEQETKRIEQEIDLNIKKQASLKQTIFEILRDAGILPDESVEINDNHITSFKNGVRRYCGLKPTIKYVVQRTDDLQNALKGLYKKAYLLCGFEFETTDDLINIVNDKKNKISSIEEELIKGIEAISNECSNKNLSFKGIDNIKESFSNMDMRELESFLNYHHNNFNEEINNSMLKIKEYETMLLSFRINDDELQKIEGEIEELELRKNELSDMSISLRTALDILTEASMEIQKDFAPSLNHRMSRIIKKITCDRYEDLRADDKLYLRAIAVESGDVVPASWLSGGTVDQIYLSLRLAMSELLSIKGEMLPFIMDEIFAQYDDERTRETMEYFREVALQRQLILFTCKKREVDIAKDVFKDELNIIELQ